MIRRLGRQPWLDLLDRKTFVCQVCVVYMVVCHLNILPEYCFIAFKFLVGSKSAVASTGLTHKNMTLEITTTVHAKRFY